MNDRRFRIPFLGWSWLIWLWLPLLAHANTLTQLRVEDSTNNSQLLLLTTHPPTYQVIPLLEQNRLVIHLANTTAMPHYPLRPFTGPLIEDIRITEQVPLPTSPSREEGASEGVRIEVVLKTADVSFTHKPLSKSPGMILIARKVQANAPRPASPPPTTAKKSAPPTEKVARDEEPLPSRREQPPGEEPSGVKAPGDTHAAQEPRPEMGLQTLQELKGLMGGEGSGEALTLLELYLNHRTVFWTNLPVLWQVAGICANLGLYEEATTLYTRIQEQADTPLLQTAALVKRGKILSLQGDWRAAESLFQEFVKNRRHGPFLAEAYEALGDVWIAQGEFGRAVEAYSEVLAHTPEAHRSPQILYKLGRAQKRAGNWVKAAGAFQKANERLQAQTFRTSSSTPGPSPAFLEVATLQQLADSLYQTHQYQGAIATYHRLLQGAPQPWRTAWAHYHLGKSYEQLGKSEEALQAYQVLTQQQDALWAEMGNQALENLQWRGRSPRN